MSRSGLPEGPEGPEEQDVGEPPSVSAKASPQSLGLQIHIERPEYQQPPPNTSRAGNPDKAAQWRSRVSKFLARMPQNEQAWESRLSSAAAVLRLRDQLVLAHIDATRRATMTWNELFSACCEHQASLDESARPFFELVFSATCFLALKKGHRQDEVNRSMRQFGQGRSTAADQTLARMRMGCVRGIEFLSIVARRQGARALALPYYDVPCLTMFEHSTPECLRYMEDNVPRINSAAHSTFEELYMPRLVFLLLGGDHSRWSYRHVCITLGAAGKPPSHSTERPTFSHLEMNDILMNES